MKRETINKLKEQVKGFPLQAGVYMMKKNEKIIYIGKAKQLKTRVRSYFNPNNSTKVILLMKHLTAIEYVITETEHEALLLENNLIKEYQPKYNVLAKDDKTFPVIKITKEDYPRVIKTRSLIKDTSTYYGPYVDANLLNIYLQFIEKTYPLRRCKKIKARKNPCLYYHIGRCAAVCANKTSKKEYDARIKKIHALLQGNTDKLARDFKILMHQHSQNLEFEEAQKYRDAIVALEKIEHVHNAVHDERVGQHEILDYIGYQVNQNQVCITVIHMKSGKVIDVHTTHTHVFDDYTQPLEQFLISYYNQNSVHAKKAILPIKISTEVKKFLKKEHGLVCKMPQDSHEMSVIRFADDNAKESLHRRIQEKGNIAGMEALQEVLKLPNLPIHIEGFDIAHVAGKHMVAAMVYFQKGIAQTSQYRHFKIKSLQEGQVDDYSALQEAVTRRYVRLKQEKKSLPHLIVIDGGLGQVNSVQEIIDVLKLNIPVVGLAKKHEEIFFPSVISYNKNDWKHRAGTKSLLLSKSHRASKLLQAIRDEAHRFSTRFREKKQLGELKLSLYTSVNGIGPQRAKKIAKIFSSPEEVKASSVDVLCKSIGLTEEQAINLKKML